MFLGDNEEGNTTSALPLFARFAARVCSRSNLPVSKLIWDRAMSTRKEAGSVIGMRESGSQVTERRESEVKWKVGEGVKERPESWVKPMSAESSKETAKLIIAVQVCNKIRTQNQAG